MTTADRVREYLKTCDLLRTRYETVADALHMANSTLRHRLQREGTTFQALLDDERKARCAAYMAQHGNRAYGKRVVDLLGYTQQNSLYRAFQRWHGVGYQDVRTGKVIVLGNACAR